jgi:hypothetical protein
MRRTRKSRAKKWMMEIVIATLATAKSAKDFARNGRWAD